MIRIVIKLKSHDSSSSDWRGLRMDTIYGLTDSYSNDQQSNGVSSMTSALNLKALEDDSRIPAALAIGLWGTHEGNPGVSQAVPNADVVIMMYFEIKFEIT